MIRDGALGMDPAAICQECLWKGEVSMHIDDAMLDKLGVYFVYHDVYARYGITFESFVERWSKGILEI